MIDPNAPTFPGVDWINQDGKKNPQGMSIRATMARRFMSDYIAHLSRNHHVVSKCYEEAAREGCRMADALIAELNKTPQP